MDDIDLPTLQKNVFDILGFNADRYEIKHFKRRIQTRMRFTESSDYKSYLRILKDSQIERENLKSALTVNVTEFFRNPEVYRVFQLRVVPELIKKKSLPNDTSIRVWSLGCSTGEEAYSIAMIFAQALENTHAKLRTIITATDIDEDALEIARKAEYSDVSKIPKGFVERYMEKTPNGKFKFKKNIVEMVYFKRHNIFSDAPLRKIDILFCRNTIIYFSQESKKDLYRVFNNSLIMNGYLILGKAESFITFKHYGFEIFEKKNHIFRKTKIV